MSLLTRLQLPGHSGKLVVTLQRDSGSDSRALEPMTLMSRSMPRYHSRGLIFVALTFHCAVALAECPLTKDFVFQHDEIGAIQVFRDTTSAAIAFASQMQVDTDGAPD